MFPYQAYSRPLSVAMEGNMLSRYKYNQVNTGGASTFNTMDTYDHMFVLTTTQYVLPRQVVYYKKT